MQIEIVDSAADLDMDEWAVAAAGDFLETSGASTCGIVAVLNHTQGRAWMVHQNTPYMTGEDTLAMLGDAREAAHEGDDIEIHLAGCGQGSTKVESQDVLINMAQAAFPDVTPQQAWGKDALLAEVVNDRWHVS